MDSGNGARRLIKINTINSFTPPVDGSNPTANNVYSGNGEQVINGATQIVEGIPLNGCNVSGLHILQLHIGSGVMNTTVVALILL